MRKNYGRQPTLKDVAQRANVSKQTVSRVINDKGEISEATRQRVLAAIRDLGYQPNALARSLVTNISHAIGLTVPFVDQPYFPQIALGVESAAKTAGYSVFLCNCLGDPEQERLAIERLRGHRVAGIISFNSRLQDTAVEQATGGLFPILMINRELPGVRGTVIWAGYESGARLATEHLIAQGRRQIAFLGLDLKSNVDSDKQKGYEGALREAGIAVDHDRILRTAGLSKRDSQTLVEGGRASIVDALERGVGFDAVFASSDLTAVGAMHELLDRGIRVPEDVAIVGFGGANVTRLVTPALSTITMPLREIGATALLMLLNRIEDASAPAIQVDTDPQLVVGASSIGMSGIPHPIPRITAQPAGGR